ncbi:MAG: 1,4-alpha-glucan branching protein GlgB [Deltaproteobacteria bacterium]
MKMRAGLTLFSDYDVHLFKEGNHFRLYDKLGSRLVEGSGERGARFAVWAPNAASVSVVGDFNYWRADANPLRQRDDGSGIWEGFISGVGVGAVYKYHIASKYGGYRVDKADPFAFCAETPPKTASVVWDLGYDWGDGQWMANRRRANSLDAPISIYEVHLGSWQRCVERGGSYLNYREIARALASYVKEAGFTHVEFLPVMEHPFYGSWGYQTVSYFAPTSRYGSPQDFMYLVDLLHQNGIGVILDWVPSHFPGDEHGLAYFDGTHLYEHQDRRQGFHPEWNSWIFNYGRREVREFLVSSALFWLDKYHADAIRVDAVASMLYLDYSRKEGEWVANERGGKENLEAIDFLRTLNEAVYSNYPDVQTIAEESTSWGMVSRPVSAGGLGFGMKWNMGWMHDALDYFSLDPIYRKHWQNLLTFSIWYAFTENFVLSISHDEVVYGKGSVLRKMPGDDWQKFANLRALFGYMFAEPGKKLLFMGAEFAQWGEWYHEASLDWHLIQNPLNAGMLRWVADLNRLYRADTALHELDFSPEGFEWVDFGDSEQSVISFIRRGRYPGNCTLAVLNLTPVARFNYVVGVPQGGFWKELLNSDSEIYGGSGIGNFGGAQASASAVHGRAYSLSLTLPALGVLFLKPGA